MLNKSVDYIPWWLRNKIRYIPGLAGIQRLIVNLLMSGKTFEYKISAGPAKGLVFPVTLPFDKQYWTGTWEKEVSETIFQNVVGDKPCLDIGSHRGFMAGIMALAGASKVYCFEPNPVNVKLLEKLKLLNPKLNMIIKPFAIADRSGVSEFSVLPETSMGKLSISTFQQEALTKETKTVDIRSLDELLGKGEIDPPSLVKIDVEGAELLVLIGAKKIIEKYSPVFIIELHTYQLAHQCIDLLNEYNYKINLIQRDAILSEERQFKVCHILATPS